MSDATAVSEPVEGGDVCCTVVCDDFFYSSPLAQDVFKDEGTKGAGILCTKCAPFGPGRE